MSTRAPSADATFVATGICIQGHERGLHPLRDARVPRRLATPKMVMFQPSCRWSRRPQIRRQMRLVSATLAVCALMGHAVLVDAEALPFALQDRWEVMVAPVYAYLLQDSRGDAHGGGAQLAFRYGISDSVGVHVSGLWTAHAVSDLANVPDSGGTLQVLSGSAGLSYVLDITRFVPRIEADVGVLHRRFGNQSTTDMAVKIGLGVDYALKSWLSVGAAFHYHGVLTNLQELPVYVDMGPRVIFGWR